MLHVRQGVGARQPAEGRVAHASQWESRGAACRVRAGLVAARRAHPMAAERMRMTALVSTACCACILVCKRARHHMMSHGLQVLCMYR